LLEYGLNNKFQYQI